MSIQRLTIIGVGLIGGSLARALKAADYCVEVVGCGRNVDSLRRGVELGVIDRFETDIPSAVSGADMVVLAAPVGSLEALFAQVVPHLDEGAVLTDVGSTKGSVVASAQAACGQVPNRFVPGHPIAGSERSGVEAADASLYRNRRVILTPLVHTAADAIDKVEAMWAAAGAVVESMGVEHHDQVLAATSHLPHLLAYALVDALAELDDKAEVFRYAAGGFRDFTRIASSDPRMWHDICLHNREALLGVLKHFAHHLDALAAAVERGDGATVLETFARAKRARDGFCEQLGEGPQSTE